MNQILVATLIAVSIIGTGAYAASQVSEMSAASSISSDIDIEKKSESMNVFFNGSINIINTGNSPSEIAMFRFYDPSGVEVHRVMMPDEHGRIFGANSPVVRDSSLTPDDAHLPRHTLQSYSLDEMGIDSLDGITGELVTKRGRTFPISFGNSFSERPGEDGAGDGQSMIDGMGLQSRIIQQEYDAKLISGSGVIGEANSIVPYLPVSSDTDFAALIENTDTVLTHYIPEFWKSYRFDSVLVDTTPDKPNILTYSNSKIVHGTPSIQLIDDGIVISGTGTIAIKPNILDDFILRGTLSEGSNVKIVTSPLDLMSIFNAGERWHLSASYPSRVFLSTGGWNMVSNLNLVVATDSDFLASYNSIGYCYSGGSISESNSCHLQPNYHPSYRHACYSYHQCLQSENIDVHSHSLTVHKTSVLTTVPVPDGIKIIKQTTTGSPTIYERYSHRILSTHPYDVKQNFTTDIKETLSLSDKSYIFVKLSGGSVTLKGESFSDNPHFLKIDSLDANIPYKIIKDGLPIVVGMTSPSGEITIDSVVGIPSAYSGILQLYPDSLAYRGPFSTVILDQLNFQTIHIESIDDIVYTVHAYVNIPVIGNVTISNTHLKGDDTLALPYLDKDYKNGDVIFVPVIPRYDSVSLEINGVETLLRFRDVLGGNAIKIAEPDTSTIHKNSLHSRIDSIEAIVGTTQYAIATSDGKIKAIVTETISGSISITNTYVLEEIPPPPPPPVRRDPLFGWVDIYKNGDFVKQVSLGTNPYPDFSPGNSILNNIVTQSVRYSYPDYVVSGTVSVDVNSGDFIEFYLYAKIHGDIDRYLPPSGRTISSESGLATATVSIRSASIQTSQ